MTINEWETTDDIRSFMIRGMFEYERINAEEAGVIFDRWFNMIVGKAWAEGRAGKDLFTL